MKFSFHSKKILKTFATMIILSTISFSKTLEVPNVQIFENPIKEVTTVEAKRNKENAKFKISVNKVNLIEIKGLKVKGGVIFSIPQNDKSFKLNESYIALNSLDEVENKFNKNKKINLNVEKPILLEKKLNKNIFKINNFNEKNEKFIVKVVNRDIEEIYRLTSSTIVDIGEVIFHIDNRFYYNGNIITANWIHMDGSNLNEFVIQSNSTNYGDISELFRVTGDFINLESTNIENVKEISGDNRKFQVTGYYSGVTYKLYAEDKNLWANEAALPQGINLLDLKKNIVISKLNIPKTSQANNNFILEGANNILYSGNIKEIYSGSKASNSIAKLDMKKGKINTLGIWGPNTGIGSANSLGDSLYVLNIQNSNLFNTRGIKGNYSVITKMVIKENGNEIANSIGNIKEDREVVLNDNIIGIEGSTGNFYIKKLTENSEEKNYEIEIYYREVLMGGLNLKIQNGYGFSINDKNKLNFGYFFPGDIKKEEALIQFTNPLNAKIDIKLKSNNNNIYKVNSSIVENTTIPISNIQINKVLNKNAFKISAEAATTENTEIGEYNGNIDIVITVIP